MKRDEPSDAIPRRSRVGVRLKRPLEDSDQSLVDRLRRHLGERDWDELQLSFPNLIWSPTFSYFTEEQIAALQQRAVENDPTYVPVDFSLFYSIDAPSQTDLVRLVRTLLGFAEIGEAFVDQPGPDPGVMSVDDLLSSSQEYLDPAPLGVDARYAWTRPGGDGKGQSLIDLERGWTLNHRDLSAHAATCVLGSISPSDRAHGTAVLGVICAVDNDRLCVGITPHLASVKVVSIHDKEIEQAILAAIPHLSKGSVLLLEAQIFLNGTNILGPVEANEPIFRAIRLATACGIIVIEAGGNGTNNGLEPALDLDSYRTLSGIAVLHRDSSNQDFRDSGAIIVSAASAVVPHVRLPYAPFGQRIDCYAWGEGIVTLYSDSAGAIDLSTSFFGGTSGASAIIAGVALSCLGQLCAMSPASVPTPNEIRMRLSDAVRGTAPALGEPPIGVMPDLARMFT